MVTHVGYSVIGRSRGRVAPCAICTMHLKTMSVSFLVEPQNQGRRFVSGLPQNHSNSFSSVWVSKSIATVCEWFGLKTTQTVFTGLTSKPMTTVSGGLASKTAATVSDGLASKPAVTVSPGLASKSMMNFLVEPQNQGGGGFSRLGLKTDSYSLVIYTSKLPRRFLGFSLKIKRASVCRLRHRTDGGRSARDMHQDLAACFV
jgi:hypothetical protein